MLLRILLAPLAVTTVFALSAAAQCPNDDAFEENDACGSEAVLSPGTYSGLSMGSSDPDHYSIDLPHGFDLTVDQVDSGAFRGLVLDVVPVCIQGGTSSRQQSVGGPTGARSLTHSNQSGATQTIYLRCFMWTDACANYDLTLTITPGSCATSADDAFELNDDCASAAALPAGLHTNLFVETLRPDYFAIQVPADQQLVLDQMFDQGPYTMRLELFSDSSCNAPIGALTEADGLNRVQWLNTSAATATVYAHAHLDDFAQIGCGRYDLNVSVTSDPCVSPPPTDFAEDNDTCATASPLFWGMDPGLSIHAGDDDYYETTLQPGQYIWVELDAYDPFAELELYLFDDSAACGSVAGGALAQSTTDEFGDGFVAYINQGAAPLTVRLLVRVSASSPRDCTRYDLFARNTGGSSLLHTFCFGDGTAGPQGAHDVACPCGNATASSDRTGCANSTGSGAYLSSQGEAILGGSSPLRLTVGGVPGGQSLMLLQGSHAIALPFKDGILCMGGPTERIEAGVAHPAGNFTSSSDIAERGSVTYGKRRCYQYWYRDPGAGACGSGSNFSNAIAVEWR